MKYCLITDRKLYTQSLPDVAAAAEAANVHFFQLREKDLPPRDLLALARSIRSVLHRTIFIVNGVLEIALASHADGVHLQSGNIPVQAVRETYRHLMIGYSAHSFEEMKIAEESGTSYIFISPVFDPSSKSSLLPAIGPSAVASWSSKLSIPVFALGGVSDENIAELKTTGCGAVAGISLFIEEGKFTTKGMVV